MALIYVLEHEPLLVTLIAASLTADGDEVETPSDASSAFEEITARAKSVDLLIASAEMRPTSGTKLIRQIRRVGVRCPVIITPSHRAVANLITKAPFSPRCRAIQTVCRVCAARSGNEGAPTREK